MKLKYLCGALLAALLALPVARAYNPDPRSPSGEACCQPCGGCKGEGYGERTASPDFSYWNFLSGRLEQEIVLQAGMSGLSLPELKLCYSSVFAPLAETNCFANYWLLSVGEYLAAAHDGGDGLQYFRPGDVSSEFVKNGDGYRSVPGGEVEIIPLPDGRFKMSDINGRVRIFSAWRKTADDVSYLRLEELRFPGRIPVTLAYNDVGKLAAIKNGVSGKALFTLKYEGNFCKSIVNATGVTVASFTYDGRELLTGVYFGAVNDATPHYAFTYNDQYRIARKVRPNGGVVSYGYDDNGVLTKATLATGEVVSVSRTMGDGAEPTIQTIGANGGSKETVTVTQTGERPGTTRVNKFVRLPGKENFTRAEYADGRVVIKEFNAAGRLTRRSGGCASCDGRGALETRNTYDNQDRVVKTEYLHQGQVVGTEKFTYNAAGQKETFTAKDGSVTRYGYDSEKRRVSTTYADGATVATAYSANGEVISATDELGRVTRYEYNAAGLRSAMITPDGARTEYGYDDYGRTVSVRYADGAVTTMKYDAIGYLCERTDALGRTEKWINDAKGNHLSHTDALGNVTRYEYDGQWRLVKVIFPDNTSERYELNADGKVIATTRRDGSVVRAEYDMWGKLTASIRPDGARMANQYNTDGRLVATKDYAGNATVFEYDAWGNVVRITDALGNSTSAKFDAMGRRISATDAMGATFTFAYDKRGRMVSSKDALGNETKIEYDTVGNPVRQIMVDGTVRTYGYDAMGRQIKTVANALDATNSMETVFEYDSRGRVVRIIEDAGAGRSNLVSTMEYDRAGQLVKSTDYDGQVTTYTYDANGKRLSESVSVNGDKLTNTVAYDNMGRVERRMTADGLVTAYGYDRLGRLVRTVADAEGEKIVSSRDYDVNGRLVRAVTEAGAISVATVRYEYDVNGNVIGQIDASGRKMTMAYDKLNRLISATDALGNTAGVTYNGRGQQLTATDANGRVRSTVYDHVGRVVSRENEMDQNTSYTYDKLGNRLTLTDANGNVSRWEYDAFGRPKTKIFPNGDTERYAYDRLGRLTSKTKPDGAVIRYEYDRLGRLVKIVFPGGEVTYEYDAWGRVARETSPVRTLSCEYDRLGRLTAVNDSYTGKTVRYAYNRLGAREKTTLDGIDITYKYDALLRLSEVQKTGEAAPAKYGYDAAGRRTALKLPNGVTTAYAYDAAGRLTKVESKNAVGTVISATNYTLDPVGNRTAIDLTLNGVQNHIAYQFDNAYRLIRETRTAGGQTLYDDAFAYDAVGNRLTRNRMEAGQPATQTVYTYNNVNQLLTEVTNGVTTAYVYDKNGNNISITTPAANGKPATIITMAYDWLNRQTRWTDGIRTESTVFAGADWQRVSTTVTDAESALNRTVKYVYDGSNVLADYGVDNSLSAFYVTPGLDQNLSMPDGAGATAYYTQDGLGSIRALTAANGAILNRYDYTAFGETFAAGTAIAVANRYTYTAREQSLLAAHGAPMYYRWRNYAPGMGRFMRRDPIGYRGGVNVYGYVWARPLVSVDIFGLEDEPYTLDVKLDLSQEPDPEFDLDVDDVSEETGGASSDWPPKTSEEETRFVPPLKPNHPNYPDDSKASDNERIIDNEDCQVVIYWGHFPVVPLKVSQFVRAHQNQKSQYKVGGLGCVTDPTPPSHAIPGFPDVSAGNLGDTPEAAGPDGNGGYNDPHTRDYQKRGKEGYQRLIKVAMEKATEEAKRMCKDKTACCKFVTLRIIGVGPERTGSDGNNELARRGVDTTMFYNYKMEVYDCEQERGSGLRSPSDGH